MSYNYCCLLKPISLSPLSLINNLWKVFHRRRRRQRWPYGGRWSCCSWTTPFWGSKRRGTSGAWPRPRSGAAASSGKPWRHSCPCSALTRPSSTNPRFSLCLTSPYKTKSTYLFYSWTIFINWNQHLFSICNFGAKKKIFCLRIHKCWMVIL